MINKNDLPKWDKMRKIANIPIIGKIFVWYWDNKFNKRLGETLRKSLQVSNGELTHLSFKNLPEEMSFSKKDAADILNNIRNEYERDLKEITPDERIKLNRKIADVIGVDFDTDKSESAFEKIGLVFKKNR